MISNLSDSINNTIPNYPISDSNLPFADYISRTKQIIEARRIDLLNNEINPDIIIAANSPYELYPAEPIMSGKRLKYGALLIHGLLDSPFSLRDIGEHLQHNGILSRAILLPGHGTNPTDLLHVSYHDWIQAVRYGVESLRKEVDEIFLVGYSTGATLSVYHALHDDHIAGILLLAPAIQIKAPVDFVVSWGHLTRWLTNSKQWIYRSPENDYAKYKSICFNAPTQVSKLTGVIRDILQQRELSIPLYMTISREDETVSSHRAIDFFSSLHNRDSKMLLYTSIDHRYPDDRITTRLSSYPALHIKHLSHVSIPFSPNNIHYGQYGDCECASRIDQKAYYGAYNLIERGFYDLAYQFKMSSFEHKELTYNPDFPYMADEITKFILS